jgi:protease PrsW
MLPFTLGASLIPSLLILWFFYRSDARPEPASLLWTCFGAGIVLLAPVQIYSFLFKRFLFNPATIGNPYVYGAAQSFFLAAIPEELFRFAFLFLFLYRHRKFDEPMDGIVYGAATSLGFASIENVLFTLDAWTNTALFRAFTAVPTHAFLGAIMGYYFGQAKFNQKKRPLRMLRFALLLPIFMHTLYDFPLHAKSHAWLLGDFDRAYSRFLLFISFVVLITGIAWTVLLVRRLAAQQPLFVPFVNSLEFMKPRTIPDRTHHPRLISLLISFLGGMLASTGGVMTISIISGLLSGEISTADFPALLPGAMAIGIVPFSLGLALFLYGMGNFRKTNMAAEVG